jgi:hypothetical protein
MSINIESIPKVAAPLKKTVEVTTNTVSNIPGGDSNISSGASNTVSTVGEGLAGRVNDVSSGLESAAGTVDGTISSAGEKLEEITAGFQNVFDKATAPLDAAMGKINEKVRKLSIPNISLPLAKFAGTLSLIKIPLIPFKIPKLPPFPAFPTIALPQLPSLPSLPSFPTIPAFPNIAAEIKQQISDASSQIESARNSVIQATDVSPITSDTAAAQSFRAAPLVSVSAGGNTNISENLTNQFKKSASIEQPQSSNADLITKQSIESSSRGLQLPQSIKKISTPPQAPTP